MIPIDVYLNGKRTYVQGTQLIARGAEALAKAYPDTAIEMRSATFHQMSDQTVSLSIGAETDNMGSPIGQLIFSANEEQKTVYLYQTGEIAPRRDISVDAESKKRGDSHDGALSADFQLSGLKTGEDLIVAIVQTVKGLHEALAEDVTDVWLTGFRSANIPMADEFPVTAGELQLRSRRTIKNDDLWQTILMASFVGSNGSSPMQTAVTFSFKSKSLTHVN